MSEIEYVNNGDRHANDVVEKSSSKRGMRENIQTRKIKLTKDCAKK